MESYRRAGLLAQGDRPRPRTARQGLDREPCLAAAQQGFPRRPRIEPATGSSSTPRCGGACSRSPKVVGEPRERDHERWPWTVEIETLLVVPVLDAAPPVEAIGVAARSMSQQSHIRITAEHYRRAVEAIASVAAA